MIEPAPIQSNMDHPIRRQRMELIDEHYERSKLLMTKGFPLAAHKAFCDAWNAIVEKEFPGEPIVGDYLAAIEGIDLRAVNVLEEYGAIETIRDFLTATREELEGLDNFGIESYIAVLEAVVRHSVERCRLLESLVLKES